MLSLFVKSLDSRVVILSMKVESDGVYSIDDIYITRLLKY